MAISYDLIADPALRTPDKQCRINWALMSTGNVPKKDDQSGGAVFAAASQGKDFGNKLHGLTMLYVITDLTDAPSYYASGKKTGDQDATLVVKLGKRYYMIRLKPEGKAKGLGLWTAVSIRQTDKPQVAERASPAPVPTPITADRSLAQFPLPIRRHPGPAEYNNVPVPATNNNNAPADPNANYNTRPITPPEHYNTLPIESPGQYHTLPLGRPYPANAI